MESSTIITCILISVVALVIAMFGLLVNAYDKVLTMKSSTITTCLLVFVVALGIAMFGFFINGAHKKSNPKPNMKTIKISLGKQANVDSYQIFLTEGGSLSLVKIIGNESENELITTSIQVDNTNKPALICIRSSNKDGFSRMVFAPVLGDSPDNPQFYNIKVEIKKGYAVYPINRKSGYILSAPQEDKLGWEVALYYKTNWYGSVKITSL